MVFLIAAVLLLVGVPYVLGPVLVKLTLKQAARPQFKPLPEGRLPEAIDSFFHDASRLLQLEGFEREARFAYRGTKQLTNLLELYLDPQSGDRAIVVAMYAGAPDFRQLKSRHVEISARFADDTVFNTGNSAVLGSFGRVPSVHTHHFPAIEDPVRLLNIHRAHKVSLGYVQRAEPPTGETPSEWMQASVLRELTRQLGTGYLRLSADADHYVPTWKGALLMTWKLCWPVKALRRLARHRANARLLARLKV